MKIADFIKLKVVEAGTQTAVSRKTGVSQGTITKILSGDTTPELGTIVKIAKGYGVNLTEFDEITPSGLDKFKQTAVQATAISKGKGLPHGVITSAVGPAEPDHIAPPDPSQMTLEQKLDWIGFGSKNKRIIMEAAKLSEEEQDELIKRLAIENIEKGRY